MAKSRKFGVFNLGFSVKEHVLLKDICRLSENEEREYNYVEAEGIEDQKIDIAIINGTSPELLQKFESWHEKHPTIPIILMSDQEVSGENISITPPPFDSTTIKWWLDTITVESFKYVPELVIGGESDDDALSSEEKDVFIQNAIDKMNSNGKSNQNILVVDDSLAVRKMMDLALNVLGWSPEFAESVKSGIDILDTKYDLIFLDVVLPDGEGFDICKTIKSSEKLKGIPVVMMTGKTSTYDRLKGKLAGCDDYLAKPVDNELLQSVLKKYLIDDGASPSQMKSS